MSEVSKTAKASMKAAQAPAKEEIIFSDTELVRLLRIDRESKLWPGVLKIDALLREYDKALVKIDEAVVASVDLTIGTTSMAITILDLETRLQAAEARVGELERLRIGVPRGPQ